MNKILSVCLITYNHEKYLEQTLESIFMQQTDFDWDLIVADDCSKDSSREILLKYKEKYPNKIHLLFQEENIGPARNFIDLIKFPKSKYIAYLEGDDYWIESDKLQKQVDFLEKNSSYVLCHTNVIGLQNNEIIENIGLKSWNLNKDHSVLEDALIQPIAFSCTSLFRTINFSKYFDSRYLEVKAGDWAFWVILLNFGNAKFINQKTAVYRMNVGVSNQKNDYWIDDFINRSKFLFFLAIKMKSKNSFTLFKYAVIYFYKYLKNKPKKDLLLKFLKLKK